MAVFLKIRSLFLLFVVSSERPLNVIIEAKQSASEGTFGSWDWSSVKKSRPSSGEGDHPNNEIFRGVLDSRSNPIEGRKTHLVSKVAMWHLGRGTGHLLNKSGPSPGEGHRPNNEIFRGVTNSRSSLVAGRKTSKAALNSWDWDWSSVKKSRPSPGEGHHPNNKRLEVIKNSFVMEQQLK